MILKLLVQKILKKPQIFLKINKLLFYAKKKNELKINPDSRKDFFFKSGFGDLQKKLGDLISSVVEKKKMFTRNRAELHRKLIWKN